MIIVRGLARKCEGHQILEQPLKSTRQKQLFNLAIVGGLSFMVFSVASMVMYPGGTIQNHHESHYLFFHNPFSDLGRTHAFDGRSNLISMTLFVIAMVSGAVGLAGFFIAFTASARHSTAARVLGSLGALLGILSGVGFLGVACTPWDLYMPLHIRFVFLAFRSLLGAMVLALIAVIFDGRLSYRLIWPFAGFIVLLTGYIILLTNSVRGGPGSGAVVQAVGQKAIVYAAILTVIVQSIQLRQRPIVLV